MSTSLPCLTAVFAAGLFIGALGGAYGACWPLTLAAAALTAAFGYGYRLAGWGLALVFCLSVTLAFSHEERRRGELKAVEAAHGLLTREMTVERVVAPWAFQATVSGVRLKVNLPPDAAEAPSPGERWHVSGWLARKDASDHSRRDLWVRGRGAFAARMAPAGWLRGALARLRAEFSRRVGLGLGHGSTTADLIRAMLLGERRRLSGDLRDAFADAGAMHVFAVSGLHVGVVVVMLSVTLRLCAVPMRWTGPAVLPFVWAYVLMIDFPPSAVRAGAMATVVMLAPLGWRRADLLSAWCAVFLLTHVGDPGLVFDVGSAMSFAVMLALIVWGRVFRRGHTVAAWAATVPISAHVFGSLTFAGLVSNLLMLPAAAFAVGTGAAAVAASYVWPELAAYLNRAAALLVGMMAGICRVLAAVPGASAKIIPWGLGTCSAWYLACVLVLWLARAVRERRRAIV